MMKDSSDGASFASFRTHMTSSLSLQSETSEDDKFSKEMNLVEKSSNRKMVNSKLADLTINKLKIQTIGLVGREEETSLLRSRLQKMITTQDRESSPDDPETDSSDSKTTSLERSNIQKELVFIKGYSGVGKTRLSRILEKDIRDTETGMLVESKFDLNASKARPFSGIAQAYSDVFQRLKRTRIEVCEEIGRELTAQLDEGAHLLTYLIPELDDFVTDESSVSDGSSDASNSDGLQERWKYGIRILTRILTSKVQPLVVCIDDLQWSDGGSLELLESLISDIQNTSPLLIIGCYRSNEVGEGSPLRMMMQNIEGKAVKFGFNITDIVLESLNVESVNQIIMEMMDIDDEDATRDLAKLCFQRTLGNPFFLIEFMNMLVREELLNFSIGTMKWGYDITRIEKATMSTANVVDLLKSRIERMPNDFQLMLRYAACLGPTFSVPMLSTIWEHAAGHKNVDELSTILQSVESEMLIEKLSGGRYRWVHDNVQEAALSSTNSDIDTFRFFVGSMLYHHLSEKEVEENLFDIADLISKGGAISIELAELCLRAANKAQKLAAFHSASRYVSDAVRMLPSDKWSSYRALTLELHVLGATVEYLIGNSNESVAYSKPVLEDDDFTLEEKLPLRLLECKRLSRVEAKHKEAVQASSDLLKDIGYNILWARSLVAVQALTALSKTARAIKVQPKGFHRKLGRNRGRYRTISGILTQLQYSAYFDQQILLVVLATCKIVDITLEHGICEYSAPAFASLGAMVHGVKKNYVDATLCCEMALGMQAFYGKTYAAETTEKCHALTLMWTKQVSDFRHVFYESYLLGMRNGEVEFSLWSIMYHVVVVPLILGRPIGPILEECPKIVDQMEEFAQSSQSAMTRCYWQMLKKLRIPGIPNPTSLDGDIMSLAEAKQHGENHVLGLVQFNEFQLKLFYGDPIVAAERAIENGNSFYDLAFAHPDNSLETFHRGVALYVAARQTRKRRYIRHAKGVRARLKDWQKRGNPNLTYYLMFLDAEQAVLDKKYDKAEELYKKAITFVGRSGYLNHAALFNELYSDFLRRERKNVADAEYRLEESLRYYREWGALGKVHFLEKKKFGCASST